MHISWLSFFVSTRSISSMHSGHHMTGAPCRSTQVLCCIVNKGDHRIPGQTTKCTGGYDRAPGPDPEPLFPLTVFLRISTVFQVMSRQLLGSPPLSAKDWHCFCSAMRRPPLARSGPEAQGEYCRRQQAWDQFLRWYTGLACAIGHDRTAGQGSLAGEAGSGTGTDSRLFDGGTARRATPW
jgi:hypothetical protein